MSEEPDFYNKVYRSVYVKHKQSPLERLMELSTYVIHCDTNFQNLNSERKAAETTALRVLDIAKEIQGIIENTRQEEAGIVMKILEVMDICYLRVFGDAMTRISFDGTNLEDWIRRSYKNQ